MRGKNEKVKFQEEASTSQLETPHLVSSQRSLSMPGPLISPAVSHRLEANEMRAQRKPETPIMEDDEVEDLGELNSFSITNRMRKKHMDVSVGALSEENYEVRIQCNDGKPRSFLFNDFLHSTIGDIKREFFEEEMNQNKNFRVIYQGRLLKDHDPVANLKVESCKVLHVFITDRIRTEPKAISTESVIETKNNLRGFDMFRDFALSEEDIIWKRYRFHSEYILLEKLEFIDDDFLVNREEFFLSENPELRGNHQKFRKFNFCQENEESVALFPESLPNRPLILKLSSRLFLFLLGFLLFFLAYGVLILCSRLRRTQRTEYQWVFLGSTLKLVICLGFFIAFNKFCILIPPFV